MRNWIVAIGVKSPDLAVFTTKALESAAPRNASGHSIAARLGTGIRCLT